MNNSSQTFIGEFMRQSDRQININFNNEILYLQNLRAPIQNVGTTNLSRQYDDLFNIQLPSNILNDIQLRLSERINLRRRGFEEVKQEMKEPLKITKCVFRSTDATEICPITHEEIGYNIYLQCHQCHQNFNAEAAINWLNQTRNCPMCRTHWNNTTTYYTLPIADIDV